MSVAVEQNRNDGCLHSVEITNVVNMEAVGTRVRIEQGSGKLFFVKCNSDFAAQYALEKLSSNFYLDYHETFLPLSPEEKVPEVYLNAPKFLVGRLNSAGLYNFHRISKVRPDVLNNLSYHEIGNLLKGRIPAKFDYETASKTLFIPFQLFRSRVTPRTYWNQLRDHTVPSETHGAEDDYLIHEAGFFPRFENGIRVR